MQECGGAPVTQTPSPPRSCVARTRNTWQQRTLAPSRRFMEADEKQTREWMPSVRPHACVCVRFPLGAAAAFHFAASVCPRGGPGAPAAVCRARRWMLTGSRALSLPLLHGEKAANNKKTGRSGPYQTSASPARKE